MGNLRGQPRCATVILQNRIRALSEAQQAVEQYCTANSIKFNRVVEDLANTRIWVDNYRMKIAIELQINLIAEAEPHINVTVLETCADDDYRHWPCREIQSALKKVHDLLNPQVLTTS